MPKSSNKENNVLTDLKRKSIKDDYDVIIHIGAPKTGSSAIQKFLLENRSVLVSLGFFYPNHGLDINGISSGHSILAVEINNNNIAGAKAIMQTYLKEAKERNCTLLLSSETLFGKNSQVKEIVGEARCKIISLFRDPIEALYSGYNQVVKRHSETRRLDSYCKSYLDSPANANGISGKVFDLWEKTFGQANLTVLKYDPELFTRHTIQSVFLSVVGINKTIQKQHFKFEAKNINNSYSLAALELKRMFNFVIDEEQHKFNHDFDYFLQGISDKSNSTKYKPEERINPETYSKLKEKFSSSSQIENKKYYLKLTSSTHTKTNTTIPKLNAINPQRLWLEMSDILVQLEKEQPYIYSYIKNQIALSIEKSVQTYEILKLAEMFNFDINQINDSQRVGKELWFSAQQLSNIPNMQLVDFYRDIAKLCYLRGDLENARRLIEKAREIRPHGPAIIKLSEQIKQLMP